MIRVGLPVNGNDDGPGGDTTHGEKEVNREKENQRREVSAYSNTHHWNKEAI